MKNPNNLKDNTKVDESPNAKVFPMGKTPVQVGSVNSIKNTKKKGNNLFWIMGLIAIGIGIGMILSWIFIFISVDSTINNILPHIQISNINFNLNETALVNAMNNTLR